jgi:hypothetical protein
MASTDTALSIASVAAQVSTIGQARAVLGTVSSTLQDGYTKLPQISTTAGLRDAAQSRLDVVNNFAQRVYAIWNDDPQLQDEEISAVNATKVGICMAQASDALKDIEDAASQEFWNFTDLLNDSLAAAGSLGGNAVQSVTNAIAAGGAAFVTAAWPTLLIVGGVVVGAYLFRKEIFSAVLPAVLP